MSFGKLEQQDYQQDVKESAQQDLSMEQILAQTSQELKDLQKNILASRLLDNQEKKSLTQTVEQEIFETNLSSEKVKLGVEKGVNNDLGDLLGDIKRSLHNDDMRDHEQKKNFRKVWRFGSGESYKEYKDHRNEQYADLLQLWSVNKYLENNGQFRLEKGSADDLHAQEDRDSIQVAAINEQKDIAANPNQLVNYSPNQTNTTGGSPRGPYYNPNDEVTYRSAYAAGKNTHNINEVT